MIMAHSVSHKIPVSVIVATRNEQDAIGTCLSALERFDEIVVVDSESTDQTATLSERFGARVVSFVWNGRHPKKRQWCLDTLTLRQNWIFFVDADEIVPPALSDEIAALFTPGPPPRKAYFVDGTYVWHGKPLRHGLRNAKITLFDRRCLMFPVVDDLDFPGMGEMEGHYQPVPKALGGARIGHLRTPLLHHTCPDRAAWDARHARYALWEAHMSVHNAWPADPIPARNRLKLLFRALPCRDAMAFIHSFVWKKGFLDGIAGLDFALARAAYYRAIARQIRRLRKAQ